LGTIDISVRFVGTDYVDKPITGSELCKELGIKIEYVPRMHTYSSTDLRERILSEAIKGT
jgi:bifunctional ADP-heptose synthase (sugar kinase/adenylyltransferase)